MTVHWNQLVNILTLTYLGGFSSRNSIVKNNSSSNIKYLQKFKGNDKLLQDNNHNTLNDYNARTKFMNTLKGISNYVRESELSKIKETPKSRLNRQRHSSPNHLPLFSDKRKGLAQVFTRRLSKKEIKSVCKKVRRKINKRRGPSNNNGRVSRQVSNHIFLFISDMISILNCFTH